MKTGIQVLSKEERVRVHEASLEILENTGVRIETAQGRSDPEPSRAVAAG